MSDFIRGVGAVALMMCVAGPVLAEEHGQTATAIADVIPAEAPARDAAAAAPAPKDAAGEARTADEKLQSQSGAQGSARYRAPQAGEGAQK